MTYEGVEDYSSIACIAHFGKVSKQLLRTHVLTSIAWFSTVVQSVADETRLFYQFYFTSLYTSLIIITKP